VYTAEAPIGPQPQWHSRLNRSYTKIRGGPMSGISRSRLSSQRFFGNGQPDCLHSCGPT